MTDSLDKLRAEANAPTDDRWIEVRNRLADEGFKPAPRKEERVETDAKDLTQYRKDNLTALEKVTATAYNPLRGAFEVALELVATPLEAAGQLTTIDSLRSAAGGVRGIAAINEDKMLAPDGSRLVEPGLGTKFAEAGGSMLGFGLGGSLMGVASRRFGTAALGLGQATRMSKGVDLALGTSMKGHAARLGAITQAQSMFRDAEAAGASKGMQYAAFFLGLPVGAVEGIGIGATGPTAKLGGIMAKIDKRSGGALGKAILAMPIIIKEGATEAAQEGFQTFSEKMIAQQILQYATPEEWDEIWAAVGENAMIGGVLGSGLAQIGLTMENRGIKKAKAALIAGAEKDLGRMVLDSAAEVSLGMDSNKDATGAPRTQASPEEAVARFAESAGIEGGLDFEVVDPEKALDPEAEIPTGEVDLYGRLNNIVGQGGQLPPIVTVNDANAPPGAYVDGVVIINKTFQNEMLAGIALHEILHTKARAGSEEFGRLVAEAQEAFPALTLRMALMYEDAFIRGERESKWYKDAKKRIEESKTLSAEAKEAALEQLEAETRPFAALPDGPERTALLIEEGFAHATQHMSLLVDEFISNPESIKPEDVAELKTVLQRIAEWLRNALAKINIGAGGKRSQALAKLDSLLKDQVKRTTQAGAKPEEVVAMAQALARVMREAKIETLPAAPKKGSPDWWRSALPSTPLLPAGPKVERIAERASEREPVIPLGSESRSSRLGRTKAAQAVNAQGEPIPLPSESLDTKGRRYRDEVAKMEQEVAAEGDPIKRRKPAPEVEPVKKKPTPPRPVTEAEAKGGPPLKAEARRQRYEAHLAKLREERGQTKKPDRARRDAGPTAAEAAIEDFERGGDRLATLTEKPTAPKKAVRPDIDEKLTPAQPKADATQAATKATATDTKKPTVAEMPRTKPDMFGETKERNATRREVVEDAGLQGQLIQEDTGQRGQASILDEEFQTEPGRIRPAGEEPIPAGREERVYRISTGAQGKMYTLRVTMLEADGNGVLVPREHYVRNLGTDWTRAVRRALKAARGQDVFGTEFTIDEINRQDAGLLKSGRYRGQSIEDVAAKDPGYIDWLWTSGTIQSKANELVLRHAAEVGVYPSAEALAMVEAATKKSQNYAKYYQQLGETPSEGIAAVHAAFAPVRRADMLREKQASNIYFEALRERKAGTREWHDPRVKPKKIKLDDVQDIAPNPEVTFGKHKGKSIEDVIKRSPKYYEWLKSSGALDGHPALRAYIDQRDQGPKSEAKPKEKPSAATVKAERSLRGRDQLRKKIREVAASDHSTFIHWLRAVGGVSNSGGDLSNFKIKENPAMRRGLPPGFPAAIQPEGKGMSPDMLVRMMIEDGWFAGYTGDTREIEEQLYETENDTDTINRFLEENPTRAEIQEGYVEPDMDPREAEAYQNLKDKGYPRNVADEIMAGEHWGVTPQSAFEDTAPDYSLEMEPPETFFPSDPAIEAIEDFEDFEDTAPDYSLEMEPPETFFPSDPAIENFERGIDRFATALSRSDAKAILLDIETGRGRIDALVERKPTIRQESIESIRMRHGDRPTFYQYVAPKSGDEVKSAAGVSSASTTLDGAMLVADGTPALIFTPGDAFARSPRLRMYSEPVERVVADVSSLSVSAAAKLGSKAIQTDRAGMISVATLVDTALSEQEVRVDLTGASAVADIPLDALHQAALSILRGNRWISLRGFIDEMRDTYRAHFGLDGGSLTPKAGAESEEADALMRSVLPFVRTPNPSPNIRFATAPTIEVDGQERHRMNSDGKPIATTDEALRNFWRWFGDSEVVDEQGRPLVVYHGTTWGFTEFQVSQGGELGRGIYFSDDPDTANMMGERGGTLGSRVMSVYLSISNPLVIEDRDLARSQSRATLQRKGYDGIIYSDAVGRKQYVAFEPTQIKSATGNRGTFSPTDPDIRRATAPLPDDRSFNDILGNPDAYQVAKSKAGGRSSVKDMGLAAERRARKMRYRVKDPNNLTDAEVQRTAEIMASEVAHQVARDSKAIGWYDKSLKKAFGVLSKAYPELSSDTRERRVFLPILAVTSNGQNVYANFKAALEVYTKYRETGRIPHKGVFGGERQEEIRNALRLIQKLIDENGVDKMHEFLVSRHEVREIKKLGYNIGDAADYVAPGSIIFGPKLGSFHANLSKFYDILTADLWFTRTYNRYIGHSKGWTAATKEKKRENLRKAVRAIQGAKGQRFFRDRGFGKTAVLSDQAELHRFAHALEKELKGFKFDKELVTSNPLEQDVLVKANGLVKELREPMLGAPRNIGERVRMREVVRRAQALLADSGIKIEVSDMQAVLWYYEKELYTEHGAANEVAKGADYADAARVAIAELSARPGVVGRGGARGKRSAGKGTPGRKGPAPDRFATSPTIEVDGQERHRLNSDGKPIAGTDEALRNFWRWFGESNVVDGQGRPVVVYHWTPRFEGARFRDDLGGGRRNRIGNVAGFYFGRESDWGYATDEEGDGTVETQEWTAGARAIPVYLSLQNTFILGHMDGEQFSEAMLDAYRAELRRINPHIREGDPWIEGKVRDMVRRGDISSAALNGKGEAMRRVYEAGGFDGIQDGPHWVAFRPEQIKSATGNRGTFSPMDPDIRGPLAITGVRTTLIGSIRPKSERVRGGRRLDMAYTSPISRTSPLDTRRHMPERAPRSG
jgi:hypothetical protein